MLGRLAPGIYDNSQVPSKYRVINIEFQYSHTNAIFYFFFYKFRRLRSLKS